MSDKTLTLKRSTLPANSENQFDERHYAVAQYGNQSISIECGPDEESLLQSLGEAIGDIVKVLASKVAESTPASTERSLGNTDINGAKKNVPDIITFGDGDTFRLLCKASSKEQGWMKSTKAMEIPGVGCVVQVTTQQVNPDKSHSIAEALTFVPGVAVMDDDKGGRRLVRLDSAESPASKF